jgi:NTP pyrophosphatase (non-canonical NTP hydrolase)
MMTLLEAQENIDKWIKEYGVRYFNELTNMALLTEEVGELSRLMARKYGEQSFKKEVDAQNVKEQIADEIADVFFVLTCLANQMDIDLDKAVQKNLEKKSKRDSLRHKQNKKISPTQ